MKKMLSANEAVACGAAQAGCVVASAYPGTPSTEILENIAKFKDKGIALPPWLDRLNEMSEALLRNVTKQKKLKL